MNHPALEINEVEFGYNPQTRNLVISSFVIKKGETVFLYGPSGSGKTTLLNLCSGILVAQKGSVKISGTELKLLSSAQRDLFRGREIGVIFQQFNLIDYLNVLENVLLPARLHPKENYRATLEKAKRLLTQLDLIEHKDKLVTKLSIGQKQRVAAARSFLMQPKFLIADEPTSSLDKENTKNFIAALLNLAKQNQTAILFVSHDENLSGYFDRKISLSEIHVNKDNES